MMKRVGLFLSIALLVPLVFAQTSPSIQNLVLSDTTAYEGESKDIDYSVDITAGTNPLRYYWVTVGGSMWSAGKRTAEPGTNEDVWDPYGLAPGTYKLVSFVEDAAGLQNSADEGVTFSILPTTTTTLEASTTSTMATTTTTTSPSPPVGCDSYCSSNGYTKGNCRQTPNACEEYNEEWRNEGSKYCTGKGSGSCCCYPIMNQSKRTEPPKKDKTTAPKATGFLSTIFPGHIVPDKNVLVVMAVTGILLVVGVLAYKSSKKK